MRREGAHAPTPSPARGRARGEGAGEGRGTAAGGTGPTPPAAAGRRGRPRCPRRPGTGCTGTSSRPRQGTPAPARRSAPRPRPATACGARPGRRSAGGCGWVVEGMSGTGARRRLSACACMRACVCAGARGARCAHTPDGRPRRAVQIVVFAAPATIIMYIGVDAIMAVVSQLGPVIHIEVFLLRSFHRSLAAPHRTGRRLGCSDPRPGRRCPGQRS